MREPYLPETTLLVGGSSSRCNACGKGADPRAATHDRVLAYSPENGSPGCGVRWTHVSSDYGQDLSRFRPDLEQVGYRSDALPTARAARVSPKEETA